MYEHLHDLIINNEFIYMEDAIDAVILAYKANNLTLEERNQLFNLI